MTSPKTCSSLRVLGMKRKSRKDVPSAVQEVLELAGASACLSLLVTYGVVVRRRGR